jgi:hypothetical protein
VVVRFSQAPLQALHGAGAHNMPLSTPAEAIPFHLVGYTWGSGRLELLWRPWPAGDASAHSAPSADAADETLRWAIARGAVLDLAAVRPEMLGERRCIGYRLPEGGAQRLCPGWRALPAGGRAQCEECERREGRLEVVASDGSRPPSGPRAGYLRSPHEIYLAAFAPDVLKVGVSGAGRTPLRVLEQGAPAALIVGRADDGLAARRLEHRLGLLSARERVPVRTKRRLLYPPPEAVRLLAALSEALATMAGRLPDGWPPDVQRLDPPQPLDNTAALGLEALTGEPHAAAAPPAGALSGLVVAAAGALLIVEQPQASLWGEAAPLAPEAHDLRRWLGWRVVRSA